MPELNDSLAWLIASAAALLMLLCLIFLTRNWGWWWLKWVVRLVPPIALVLPVGVPGSSGFYAPAFVVALFEQFLQENGDATAAVARLVMVVGAVVCLVTLAALARWGRNRTNVSRIDPEAAVAESR